MKIKIDRKSFAQALAEVAPYAPAKSPIEVLKFAKITAEGDWMKIEAHDRAVSLSKYVKMEECDGEGAFLIPIVDLSKFVSKTNGDHLDLSYDGSTIKISHSKGEAEFNAPSAEQYPTFKVEEEATSTFDLPTSFLAEAISRGEKFVSTDLFTPALCSIYVYINDGEFGYCATDTRKLIHGSKSSQSACDGEISWLIVPTVFGSLKSLCKTNETAKISISDNHVSYAIGQTLIQCVKQKGKYPDFRRVIPTSHKLECLIDKNELADSINRTSLFGDKLSAMKMQVSQMDMVLTASSLEYSRKSVEHITHNGCNGEITIGVNSDSLFASISAFDGANILMKMTDPNRPILFEQNGEAGLVVILMPMLIQQ